MILCADDFALAPGVSLGIVDLLETGSLPAVSCMTVSRWWPEHSRWLLGCRGSADIGLHFTLTDQLPLGPMPELAPQGRLPAYRRLLERAYCRRLPAREIGDELNRQLDAFEAELGAPPAFLDGHQYVHQLPVVRDVVMEVVCRRLVGSGAYVRNSYEAAQVIWNRRVSVARALTIRVPAIAFRRLARRYNVPTNDGFSGVYDFSGRVPYARLFERFLIGLRRGGLVLCHPGLVDDELRRLDQLTDQREVEYRYFSSSAFPEALAKAGMRIGPGEQ